MQNGNWSYEGSCFWLDWYWAWHWLGKWEWLITSHSPCSMPKFQANYVVFYLLAMHWEQRSNFWKSTSAQKPCWCIHNDGSFFTRLWASQNFLKKCNMYSWCSVPPTNNAPGPDVQCFGEYQCSKTWWRLVNTSTVTGWFSHCPALVKKWIKIRSLQPM